MSYGTVILTGASGMLGSSVRRALNANRFRTLQLLRRVPGGEGQLQWDPAAEVAIENPHPLEGAEAAIHLSGASVAGRRWSVAYKKELTTSRVVSTRRISETLAGLQKPPRSLLIASAVGIYGDRGDEILTEESAPGEGFLAELCQQWEDAATPAVHAGIRVVHLRFGVVLGPGKGALERMIPPFRVGLGTKLGSGRQWMSWISLADAIAAILFAMKSEKIQGPVNVTAPNPVTNAEFTRSLGRQLGRPAFLTVPASVLRIMFGQMAEEALLASACVHPEKLMSAGFRFSMPGIEEALRAAVE